MRHPLLLLALALPALALPALSCSSSTAPSLLPAGTATLTLSGALSAHASLPAHAFYRTQVNIPWPADSSSSRPQPTEVVILLTPQTLKSDSVPQTVQFLNDGGQSVRVTAIGQGISPIFWSTSGSVTFTSLTGNEMAGHIDAQMDSGPPWNQTVHITGEFRAE